MPGESIEHQPDQPIKKTAEPKPDTAGDPIFPDELIKLVGEEDKPPKTDIASIGHTLGLTPQEVRAFELRRNEQLGKVAKAGKKPKPATRLKIKKTPPSREQVQTARFERRTKTQEPISETQSGKIKANLEARPDLEKIYTAVIENNTEALAEKSREQLTALEKMYYGTDARLDRILPWKKKARAQERFNLETKLEDFQKFVNSLEVVQAKATSDRATENDLSGAENFVYGSFESNGRTMAGDNIHEAGDTDFQGVDLNKNAQLVTNDLHHIARRTTPDRTLEAYTKNVFDYQTGQEILAIYLASVFKDPAEAQTFLNDGYNKNDTNWQYRLKPIIGDQTTDNVTRAQEIISKAGKIWDKTGIYLPTNLEIRVDRTVVEKLTEAEVMVA